MLINNLGKRCSSGVRREGGPGITTGTWVLPMMILKTMAKVKRMPKVNRKPKVNKMVKILIEVLNGRFHFKKTATLSCMVSGMILKTMGRVRGIPKI